MSDLPDRGINITQDGFQGIGICDPLKRGMTCLFFYLIDLQYIAFYSVYEKWVIGITEEFVHMQEKGEKRGKTGRKDI